MKTPQVAALAGGHGARASWAGFLADWAELTRLRLSSLMAFCAFVGALLAVGPGAGVAPVVEATLWTTLSAAAASILNQVLERDVDGLMERTASRPLVTGRVSTATAALVGGALGLTAVAMLAWRFNTTSALIAATSLFLYVGVYTPLKRVSTLNTVVGALPGAAPAAIAYTALAGGLDGWGLALFLLVFTWQFPHFLAIAYLYREQYRRAGMRMLPGEPGGEHAAGRQSLLHALVLLPIVLSPAVGGLAGPVYAAGAALLAGGLIAFAARFALRPCRARARALLFASLVHLPLHLSLILFDPVVRLSFGA